MQLSVGKAAGRWRQLMADTERPPPPRAWWASLARLPPRRPPMSVIALPSRMLRSGAQTRLKCGGHELLITLVLFLTTPVSAHLLIQAALKLDAASRVPPPGD